VNVPSAAPRNSVDPQASEIRLLVYRDGPLARFGHNHVVVGRVHGEIRAGDAAAASGFRLEIPVDPSRWIRPQRAPRKATNCGTGLGARAPRHSREHARKDVLDAEKHPLIRVESIALVGPQWGPTVTARVTLRGVTRDLRFAAAVLRQDGMLVVIAGFRINQSEFGIEPFTALNGGLRVRDALDIRVRLVARR